MSTRERTQRWENNHATRSTSHGVLPSFPNMTQSFDTATNKVSVYTKPTSIRYRTNPQHQRLLVRFPTGIYSNGFAWRWGFLRLVQSS